MQQLDVLDQECKWHNTGVDIERILLVVLKNGVIIGSSAVSWNTRTKDDVYFESTFVNEGYRRMGVATLLNERGLEVAKSHGARWVWVSVNRGNRFYIKWFLKHGFKVHRKDPVNDTVLFVCEL
ncbi:MAG: GNAT family N-acetyltransferase [Flavobacteriales bacterium]|nr:GNAT family N-acetyltransferase [Flavobacteriales bacterium]